MHHFQPNEQVVSISVASNDFEILTRLLKTDVRFPEGIFLPTFFLSFFFLLTVNTEQVQKNYSSFVCSMQYAFSSIYTTHFA